MIRIKQDPDALDLTNRPQHLLSDEEENYSVEDDTHDCIPKVCTHSIPSNHTHDSSIFRKQHMIVVLLIQAMRIIVQL